MKNIEANQVGNSISYFEEQEWKTKMVDRWRNSTGNCDKIGGTRIYGQRRKSGLRSGENLQEERNKNGLGHLWSQASESNTLPSNTKVLDVLLRADAFRKPVPRWKSPKRCMSFFDSVEIQRRTQSVKTIYHGAGLGDGRISMGNWCRRTQCSTACINSEMSAACLHRILGYHLSAYTKSALVIGWSEFGWFLLGPIPGARKRGWASSRNDADRRKYERKVWFSVRAPDLIFGLQAIDSKNIKLFTLQDMDFQLWRRKEHGWFIGNNTLFCSGDKLAGMSDVPSWFCQLLLP